MNKRLIIDNETLAKLRNLEEPLEICDESGHTLGFFKPLENRELYRTVKVPELSEEEVERRLQEGKGRTLDEILADLEKR